MTVYYSASCNMKIKTFYTLSILILLVTVCIESYILFTVYKSDHKICNNKKDEKKSIEGKFARVNDYSLPKGAVDAKGLVPERGFVPDYRTAVKIAEAIWLPIFGKAIYDDAPFNAALFKDSIWVVTGSLPPNTVGGSFYIKLNKSDGRILKVTHEK